MKFWQTSAVPSLVCCKNLQWTVTKCVHTPPGTLLETVPGFVSNLIEHIDFLAFSGWSTTFAERSARLGNWGSVIATLATVVSRGGKAGHGALVVARQALFSDSPVLRNRSDLLMLAFAVLDFCLFDSSASILLAALVRKFTDATQPRLVYP
jgi:hypothetical protein